MNTSPMARLATTAGPALRARAWRRASTRDSGARDASSEALSPAPRLWTRRRPCESLHGARGASWRPSCGPLCLRSGKPPRATSAGAGPGCAARPSRRRPAGAALWRRRRRPRRRRRRRRRPCRVGRRRLAVPAVPVRTLDPVRLSAVRGSLVAGAVPVGAGLALGAQRRHAEDLPTTGASPRISPRRPGHRTPRASWPASGGRVRSAPTRGGTALPPPGVHGASAPSRCRPRCGP